MAGFHGRSRVELAQLASQQQQQLAAQERAQFAVYKVQTTRRVIFSAVFNQFGVLVGVDVPARH